MAVVYNNMLIGENYMDGYDAWTKFHGWSMTKSVTGAMAGLLVMDGWMDIKAPVDIPQWSGDDRRNITPENILHLSSGLDWVENYFTISDATIMLMQSDDMFSSIVDCKLAHTPGSYWNYSSGDVNLLSGLIRKSIGNDDAYHGYPYSHLVSPHWYAKYGG